MHFARLHISGLRNIRSADLSFSQGFNYIYGANGAGKTAVLEALHVLARGRSFRATNLDQLINRNGEAMIIRAEVQKTHTQHRLGYSRAGTGNEFSVDGQRGGGFAGLAEHIAVQTLLPNSAELIYGSPGERRRFLDWGLFHVEHDFLHKSRRYTRTLQQRNAWLKQQSETVQIKEDPWVESISDLAGQLSEARANYVDRLGAPFRAALESLSSDLLIDIEYDWGGLQSQSEVQKKMSESFSRDVKFGSTQRGPHRADLTVNYQYSSDESSGHDKAQNVLSRGQAKVVASALMLAQVELQRAETGEGSVVLIDDFGAELDVEHWNRFVRALEQLGCQVISTSTEPPNSQSWLNDVECDVFHVEHGAIVASKSK